MGPISTTLIQIYCWKYTHSFAPSSSRDAGKIWSEARIDLEGLDEKIHQLYGLFVFIKDFKIYLIHQTAREFLINNISGTSNCKWHFGLVDIESKMTQVYVKYLLMDDLVDIGPEGNDNIQNFLEYSACN